MPWPELRRAACVGLLIAAGLPGCGGTASPHPETVTITVPGAPSGTVARTLPAQTSAAASPPAVRSPALRHLQAGLNRALTPAGARVGALVEDLSTGEVLYTREAGVARPPASVEKLYTSAALLALLGPEARLHTEILGAGRLGAGGVWHGNLYLRGDGDPTFGDATFVRLDEGGQGASTAVLLAGLRARGIRAVTGRLYADASRFDVEPGGPLTAGAPDVPDYGGQMSALVYDHGLAGLGLGPAGFAAHAVALTARASGIRVLAARRTAEAPGDAEVLARVASPPLPVLLRLMDVPSDDLFADLLTKQLGYHFAGSGTLDAGAREIDDAVVTRYRLSPRVEDGSGLDKADRTTPAQVVTLLRELWHTGPGAMLGAALPVVGVSGTVATLGLHTPAAGHCSAKTGTLDRVTNLAGYCTTAGGDTVAFALFVDGPENWQAIPVLSRAVGAIAGY